MSDDKFLIEKSESGEMSASFSPGGKVSREASTEGKLNAHAPSDLNTQTADELSETKDQGDSGGLPMSNPVKQDFKEFEESLGDNDDSDSIRGHSELGDPTLTSTPIVHRDSGVVSTCESDKAPLLLDRSSTMDSCISLDGDGERDDISEASCGCSYEDNPDVLANNSMNNLLTSSRFQPREALMVPGSIRVPIVGYETMEARQKFTVYKIHVLVEEDDAGWFIFRRYSDFIHLNDQLKVLFPNFRLALPPKRWFRSSFDADFLEERQLGLQAFLDNITGHRDICKSQPVREFFCFDDPPGPHDSVEESRAQCECLEEMVYLLRKELSEKDIEMDLMKEELELYKNQVHLLTNRLSELNRVNSLQKSGSERRATLDGSLRDIDVIFGSGDRLTNKKLHSLSDLKLVELRTPNDGDNEQLQSPEDT